MYPGTFRCTLGKGNKPGIHGLCIPVDSFDLRCESVTCMYACTKYFILCNTTTLVAYTKYSVCVYVCTVEYRRQAVELREANVARETCENDRRRLENDQRRLEDQLRRKEEDLRIQEEELAKLKCTYVWHPSCPLYQCINDIVHGLE